MHTRTILRAVRRYAPDLHTHQLRHFFATQLMEAGVALSRVSALLGHSTIAVTSAFYIHPNEDGDRAAIDLLAGRMRPAISGGIASDELDALLSDTN